MIPEHFILYVNNSLTFVLVFWHLFFCFVSLFLFILLFLVVVSGVYTCKPGHFTIYNAVEAICNRISKHC